MKSIAWDVSLIKLADIGIRNSSVAVLSDLLSHSTTDDRMLAAKIITMYRAQTLTLTLTTCFCVELPMMIPLLNSIVWNTKMSRTQGLALNLQLEPYIYALSLTWNLLIQLPLCQWWWSLHTRVQPDCKIINYRVAVDVQWAHPELFMLTTT